MASGTIAGGVLRYSRVLRQTATYRVRGPAKEPRQLVIVQRRLPGWTLVKPERQGMEISEGNYRIPLQLPGGDQTGRPPNRAGADPAAGTAAARRQRDQIKVFAQATEFDAKTREALTKVLQLQQAVVRGPTQGHAGSTARSSRSCRSRRACATISRRVPADSDLQRRYLATLDKQETELEAIATRRTDAEKAVETARDALRTYVSQLG